MTSAEGSVLGRSPGSPHSPHSSSGRGSRALGAPSLTGVPNRLPRGAPPTPKVVSVVIRGRFCAGSHPEQRARRTQKLGGARRGARDPSGRCACGTGPRGGASRAPRLSFLPPAPEPAAGGHEAVGGPPGGSGGPRGGAATRTPFGSAGPLGAWENRRRDRNRERSSGESPRVLARSSRGPSCVQVRCSGAAPRSRPRRVAPEGCAGDGRWGTARAVCRRRCWAHGSWAASRLPRFLPEGPCQLLTRSLPTPRPQKLTGATRTNEEASRPKGIRHSPHGHAAASNGAGSGLASGSGSPQGPRARSSAWSRAPPQRLKTYSWLPLWPFLS